MWERSVTGECRSLLCIHRLSPSLLVKPCCFEAEGRGFDSLQARHRFNQLQKSVHRFSLRGYRLATEFVKAGYAASLIFLGRGQNSVFSVWQKAGEREGI
jgi:hypothetical protein